MTDAICYRDAYARSVDATVTVVEPGSDGTASVVLDRTVFYPGGGGQPPDQGWLALAGNASQRWSVRAASRSGDDLVHRVEPGDGGPAVGDVVVAGIDWERRYALMRTHTALHTLCGVVWRDHGALVTGGNMEPGHGRLDFEFESLTGDLVAGIEARVNEEVQSARPIHVRVLPRDEAFAIPDLIRTRVNLLPEGIREVRVIEIEGLDLQADGGTHVANTSEVGPIRVAGYESKGRINKRIRIQLVDPNPA
jgi:misacylated tRNA(Ala) deacylase